MALLDCEAIPKRGASPEELRALGGALGEFARRECGDTGMLHFISRLALANLSNGHPPPPFLEQYQELLNDGRVLSGDNTSLDPVAQKQERIRLREVLGDAGQRRTLFFQVRGSYATRKRVIADLRRNIPDNLVDDVLVGEKSWDGT